MDKEVLWKLDEHTKGKHKVLKRYLQAWLPIVSSKSDEILIVDGFSGPGEYALSEDGSPVIMLKTFIEHNSGKEIQSNVSFAFVEKDKARFEHLKKLLSKDFSDVPSNCNYSTYNGSFDHSISREVLAEYDKVKSRKSCFIMIDPFGVSDTPIQLVGDLLKRTKAEIFISVMYEHINRFLKTKQFNSHLTDLFGTPEWIDAFEIKRYEERKAFLLNLYKSQLKKHGASDVIHFELYRKNKLVYTIFFATTHWKGADKMKSAIWSAIPDGTFKFVGRKDGLALDSFSKDYSTLISQLINDFDGQVLSTREILKYIGSDKTLFSTDGAKANVLKALEKSGNLVPIHDYRKRKFSYPPDFRFKIICLQQDENDSLTRNISLF